MAAANDRKEAVSKRGGGVSPVWAAVDAVLNAYDPDWVDQEIGDKAEQRERMRRALVAAGLIAERT